MQQPETLARYLTIIVLALLVAACGLKGDLYLPEQPGAGDPSVAGGPQ
ncbi:MAG: lipoprotein [Gammaproteobacteria bacterium]|nr:lipoprotein [Gammaproteobacteria bacterium]